MIQEKEILDIFASQTAIMATLIEHLVRSHVVDKPALIKELYALLALADQESDGKALGGPIKHLLSILEHGSE